MKKNKIILIFLSIFVFLLFSVVQYQKSKSYPVLSIKSPFEIIVDLNKNGIEDENECITILDGYEYIHRGQTDNNYNISKTDMIALSYLTEKFVNDWLKEQQHSYQMFFLIQLLL